MCERTVDVIIPCFNGATFLDEAIRSVLAQSHKINKIMVINDGSTDNSREVVLNIAQTNKNVILIEQENRGLSSARNLGLAKSTSEFIAFLDSDDTWLADKIELQLIFFSSNPDCVAVGTGYSIIDENSLFKNKGKLPTKPISVNNLISGRSFLPGSASAILIQRKSLSEDLKFDLSLEFAEDLDFWINLAKLRDLCFIEPTLVNIRQHKTSMQSRALTQPNRYLQNIYKIQRKHQTHVGVTRARVNEYLPLWQVIKSSLGSFNLSVIKRIDFAFLIHESNHLFIQKKLWKLNLLIAILIGMPTTIVRRLSDFASHFLLTLKK
jgi:glycosyltransferase involved in cell wall biosynthesis